VPLPGGTVALARALDVDPVPDRGRFIFEITRLVYGVPEGSRLQADAFLTAVREASRRGRDGAPDRRPADVVPVPLSAELWSSAIFRRKVALEDLVVAIVADRSAALLCHGLASLDDETLAYFADHPALLTRIYEHSAPLFAAFSDGLQVRDDRIVLPGGEDAQPLWEALLLEKTTRPDRFVQQLFELNDGRLAFLYDVIAQLDPARRAFALGVWMPDATIRVERFKELAHGFGSLREWHVRTQPFGRVSHDPAMMFWRVAVGSDGAPLEPSSRALWQHAFHGDDPLGDLAATDSEPFDAAWLMSTIESAEVRVRAARLDQLGFGTRVFSEMGRSASQNNDVLTAIRGVARYRMLMLTLERIGIRTPALYAAAARRADQLAAFEGRQGFELQAQFQGALALIAGMVRVRTIDSVRAGALIAQLVALPLEQGRFGGSIATFVREDLVSGTAPADSLELRVLRAISGPASAEPSNRPIIWEGQSYRLDLGAAELRRLQRVRDKQDGVPLDVALELTGISHALANRNVSSDELTVLISRLGRALEDVPQRSRHDEEVDLASGFGVAASEHDALQKIIDELGRAERARDLKRAARLSEPLGELADQVLAHVLLSIAYAMEIGDPDSTVLLAGDVSRRHDFGFNQKSRELRMRAAWAVPRQDVSPGMPWRVSGSLLALDVGLAPLALRRVNFERVLEAPKITSNEREAFALSVSLINPFALRDADLDTIADAIATGRRRLQALSRDGHDLDPIADQLRLQGWRRRALRWTLANEPERASSLLSLTELLSLGGARLGELNAWGMAGVTLDGCLCSRLTPLGAWPILLGRPQLGLVAVGVADLHLQVAMILKELHLPSALAKVVLSAAVQDYIDEVSPTDAADWLTMVRTAWMVSPERVEDYMAAATAVGPLMLATDTIQ
jgi:hypothetical protein